jgi:hypothetical protein
MVQETIRTTKILDLQEQADEVCQAQAADEHTKQIKRERIGLA